MYTTSVLYAVFTMIRSRPVSCTYCDIINLSITTITLCIAQENVCIVINITIIMICHVIIESCVYCYFLTWLIDLKKMIICFEVKIVVNVNWTQENRRFFCS